jgi:hypothetical protein
MLTPTPASIVHIEPNREGRWVVRYGEDYESCSEHNSATEAERAARAQVGGDDGALLLVRDRYARVRVAAAAGPP